MFVRMLIYLKKIVRSSGVFKQNTFVMVTVFSLKELRQANNWPIENVACFFSGIYIYRKPNLYVTQHTVRSVCVTTTLASYSSYFLSYCGKKIYMSQMKHQLDATLCRFYFCRVTLHVSGASTHHQEYLKLVQRPLVHVLSLQVSHRIAEGPNKEMR